MDHLDQLENTSIYILREAYGNFKSLLESRGMLQDWFDFENQQEKRALRQWCEEHGIEISG